MSFCLSAPRLRTPILPRATFPSASVLSPQTLLGLTFTVSTSPKTLLSCVALQRSLALLHHTQLILALFSSIIVVQVVLLGLGEQLMKIRGIILSILTIYRQFASE